MNFRPLCTAIVCPTISGVTVERRDQVLMTFLSPPRFMASIFSRSGTSTNGPFLSDLDIAGSYTPDLKVGPTGLLLRTSLNNESVSAFVIPRLVALGRNAPRGHRVPAARGLAFAAAERVVHRVHRDAADVRPLPEPAAPARLADRDVLVIEVADLADRRVALDVDLPDFPGWHRHPGVF